MDVFTIRQSRRAIIGLQVVPGPLAVVHLEDDADIHRPADATGARRSVVFDA
jgi:hypothetical protein